MGRKRRARNPEADAVPAAPDEEENLPGMEGGVAPQVATRDGVRFEGEIPADVSVIEEESYYRVRDFIGGRPDRSKFRLAFWRCDPDIPEDRTRHKWLGRFPIPEGILEEFLALKFGPGHYRWQLTLGTRFMSRRELPPTMRDIPMEGFVQVGEDRVPEDGRPFGDAGGEVVERFAPQDDQAALMREVLAQVREDNKNQAGSMVAMMQVMLQGMQAQAGAAATLAQQQMTFLLKQMEERDRVYKESRAEKDDMWSRMFDVVREVGGGGEPRDATSRLIDNLPGIVGELNRLTVGRRDAPAPAAANPTPVQALPAPAGQQEETEAVRIQKYVGEVINEFMRWHRRGKDAEFIASILEELGTDEEYDWLTSQDVEQVVGHLAELHKQFMKADAPADLLAKAREVFTLMGEAGEEEPEAAPPAVVEPPAAQEVVTPPETPSVTTP